MGLDARRQHVESLHVVVVAVEIKLHHLHRLKLLETCLLGYLVFSGIGVMLKMADIRDISDVTHLIAQVTQITEKYVKRDCGASMPQMCVAIYSRPAHIHAHVTIMYRLERHLDARERIVERKVVVHYSDQLLPMAWF